jgi:hypothetical protein
VVAEAEAEAEVTGLLLLAALSALPARAERRYRVEMAGEHVGFAELAIACAGGSCRVRFESALRAPAGTGGGVLERWVEIEAAPGGEARRVRARQRGGRAEREVEDGPGPAPASLAETLLSAAGPGERRCIAVREEHTGQSGTACATREGEWLAGEVLGAQERFRARPGEPPDEVDLPGQGIRFLADPRAGLPPRAPRLYGAEVPADPGAPRARGLRFCGRTPEPRPLPLPPGIPLVFPEGASCRERTARWLEVAARTGLAGRHVVGVAWDGSAFVWHEWAEVWADARWVPVDPSFGQAPAEGPRFAVARFGGGDRAAEGEAGEGVLACWGRSRVEAPR